MIAAMQLQRLLREFGGPLATLEVKPSPVAPQLARISWICQIKGQPHYGETDYLDLASFSDTTSVLRLAGQILQSLEQAQKIKG